MKAINELLRTSNKTSKSKEFTQIVKTKWSIMLLLIVMLMPQGAWAIEASKPSSGDGSSNNPYLIASEANYIWFRDAVNNGSNSIYAKLIDDITLSNGSYTPIGTESKPYKGGFDGNNKTIKIGSSLTCYQESSYTDKAFGLFGYIDGAYIHDLKVAGSKADSKMEVARKIAATVVGKALNSSSSTTVVTKIYNVQSSVNINLANYSGYLSYGGIVGDVDGEGLTEIKGCTYSGKIYAYSTITGVYGGVVGQVEMTSKASIAYCFFSGEIETTSTNSQYITVGGILGSVLNPGVYNPITKKTKYTQYFNGITNCFSCGTITSSATAKGGIIGGAAQMTVNTSNTVNNYYLSGKGATTAINADESDVVASTNAAITVTVASSNANYGSVSQSYVNPTWNAANSTGTATQLQVSATPADHYHFVSWSDGGAQTHTKSLTADISITASFAIDQYAITVSSSNDNRGTVTGGGTYEYNTQQTITATPKEGYHFVCWNDGNTDASRQITITGPTTYTATFEAHTYGEWIEDAPATCTANGTQHRLCTFTGCEGREDTDIPALGHTKPTDPAAYDDNGFGVCTVCGAEVYQPLGEPVGGYYDISNAGQLYSFAELVAMRGRQYAILTADIVVNKGYFDKEGKWSEEGTPRMWKPIRLRSSDNLDLDWDAFYGIFDGNHHTISGLYCTIEEEGVGLFGSINHEAKIENLSIINSYFQGEEYVGSIAGANSGKIINCYANAFVKGVKTVGGISGDNWGASVKNCYFTGTVSGTTDVGGICGYNNDTVTNCYITATVTGTENCGGICGDNTIRNDGTGSVTNCYTNNTLPLVAKNDEGCTAEGETNVSVTRFASGEITYLLNGCRSEDTKKNPLAWFQQIPSAGSGESGNNGDSFPVLKKDGESNTVYGIFASCNAAATPTGYSNTYSRPAHTVDYVNGFGSCSVCQADVHQPLGQPVGGYYEIGNAGQLYSFAEKTNDENNTINGRLIADIDLEGVPFMQIGSSLDYKYRGTLDGQYKAIKNININANKEYAASLIGYATDANIQNLTVQGTITTSAKFAAGLVGQSSGTNIKNCISDVDIVSTVNGDGSHGGLVGRIYDPNIIENCAFIGSIKSETGTTNCAGLVGLNSNSSSTKISFKNCYVAAEFSDGICEKTICRGNDATITNCYYLNSVGDNTQGTQITAAQLKNGALCYLLNGSRSEGTAESPLAWYQKLGDDGDTSPVLVSDGSNTVRWDRKNEAYTNRLFKLTISCLGKGDVYEPGRTKTIVSYTQQKRQESISLSALGKDGDSFVYWTLDGEVVGMVSGNAKNGATYYDVNDQVKTFYDPNYTFTFNDCDAELVAHFEPTFIVNEDGELLCCNPNVEKGGIEEIVIPEGVKIIKAYAFNMNRLSGNLCFPKSLEQIQTEAFKVGELSKSYYTFNSLPVLESGCIEHQIAIHNVFLCDNSYVANSFSSSSNFDFGSTVLTFNRAIRKRWDTLFLPFEAKIDEKEPYEFYVINTITGTHVTLRKLTGSIPAQTPVIMHVNSSVNLDGSYVMNLKSKEVAFYGYEEKTTDDYKYINNIYQFMGCYQETDLNDYYYYEPCYVFEDAKFWNTKMELEGRSVVSQPFSGYIHIHPDYWDSDQAKIECLDIVLPGDLNADGDITIVDQTLLIKLLNSNGTITNPAADVDGDNNVTVNDVNALGNKILEVK